MVVKPVLQALILADYCYVDRDTGKKVLAGIFDRFTVTGFPARAQQCGWIYVSLTDVQGQVPISFQQVDLNDNKVLFKTDPRNVSAASPLDSVDIIVRLDQLLFPHEGVYALEVWCGDELVGAKRVYAEKVSE